MVIGSDDLPPNWFWLGSIMPIVYVHGVATRKNDPPYKLHDCSRSTSPRPYQRQLSRQRIISASQAGEFKIMNRPLCEATQSFAGTNPGAKERRR
jgi:hypothetical protein